MTAEEARNSVYVGRPSRWGNPYTHLPLRSIGVIRVKTREEAIAKYREHLDKNPHLKRQAREQLRGKNLVCWCAPLPCHADVLLEVANAD